MKSEDAEQEFHDRLQSVMDVTDNSKEAILRGREELYKVLGEGVYPLSIRESS